MEKGGDDCHLTVSRRRAAGNGPLLSPIWRRRVQRLLARRVRLAAVAALSLVVASGVLATSSLPPSRLSANSLRSAAMPAPTRHVTPSSRDQTALHNRIQGCNRGQPPAPAPQVVRDAGSSDPSGRPPNEVALTFDDGSSPYSSPAVLVYLERTHTPATFFVIGLYARQWPSLVVREWNDGFAIGMHTWSHPMMIFLSLEQQRFQFSATLQALHDALGARACL
jgi:hypothetical protein